VSHFLDQNEWWVTRGGQRIKLHEMSATHRRNVVRHLEHRAAAIEQAYTLSELRWLTRPIATVVGVDHEGRDIEGPPASLMPGGEMAQDALNAEWERRQADPVGWLHTTALVMELDRLCDTDRRIAQTTGRSSWRG